METNFIYRTGIGEVIYGVKTGSKFIFSASEVEVLTPNVSQLERMEKYLRLLHEKGTKSFIGKRNSVNSDWEITLYQKIDTVYVSISCSARRLCDAVNQLNLLINNY